MQNNKSNQKIISFIPILTGKLKTVKSKHHVKIDSL